MSGLYYLCTPHATYNACKMTRRGQDGWDSRDCVNLSDRIRTLGQCQDLKIFGVFQIPNAALCAMNFTKFELFDGW